MLLRVILKNFLSFENEVMFDMFPNIKKTLLPTHIYRREGHVPVLKQAAIFGPNGAGKSNLVKGLDFLQSFVTQKDVLKRQDLDRYCYRLKPVDASEPIYLAIEFEFEGQYFFYEIEVLKEAVKRETLYESFPLEDRFSLIFERKASQVEYAEGVSVDNAIVKATQTMLQNNPLSSFIALNKEFPLVQDERVEQVHRWFAEQLEVIDVHTTVPQLIDILRQDEGLLNFMKHAVATLQLGVSGVDLNDQDFDEWAKYHTNLAKFLPNQEASTTFTIDQNDNPIFSISIENGIRKVYLLLFEQVGRNGYVGHLDAGFQSDGTLRALMLLPAIYCAITKGKTAVVDEINSFLSHSMVRGLVGYFANTEHSNGQLIFTTHDTELLEDKDILRSDEVWFVDKKEGASIMYSHNDFKEHHSISMYKGYNEGRFGAIRFINLNESRRDVREAEK